METLAISFTPLCQCLSEETLKAVGPFYLVSMPGEVKYPISLHWKCVTAVDSTTHSNPPPPTCNKPHTLRDAVTGRNRNISPKMVVGWKRSVVNPSREADRGGEGRGEGEGGMTVIHILIGMFNSNPMIPQYLNNNLT